MSLPEKRSAEAATEPAIEETAVPTAVATAGYIAELLSELEKLAVGAKLVKLAYLLREASDEASSLAT